MAKGPVIIIITIIIVCMSNYNTMADQWRRTSYNRIVLPRNNQFDSHLRTVQNMLLLAHVVTSICSSLASHLRNKIPAVSRIPFTSSETHKQAEFHGDLRVFGLGKPSLNFIYVHRIMFSRPKSLQKFHSIGKGRGEKKPMDAPKATVSA